MAVGPLLTTAIRPRRAARCKGGSEAVWMGREGLLRRARGMRVVICGGGAIGSAAGAVIDKSDVRGPAALQAVRPFASDGSGRREP